MCKYAYFVFNFENNLVLRCNSLRRNKYCNKKSGNKEVAYG